MSLIRINPKVDLAFRKLFGSEENKDLLISLINSIVEPEFRIVDLSIKNPFNLATYQGMKESILDIKAVDQDGIWYDIEMQLAPHMIYGKRAVYYLARLYAEQLDSGDDYTKLNTTIGIHFLDFAYFPDDRMVRQFVLKDADSNERHRDLSVLRLYFIELSKFDKEWPQVRTTLDRWAALLNRARELDRRRLPSALAMEPAIVKAFAELERIGLDPETRAIYEGEEKAVMIGKIEMETAKQQGIQQGLQQGLQHFLLRQMTARFGDVPSRVSSRVSILSVEQLEDLGLAITDFTSYADVDAWLTRH